MRHLLDVNVLIALAWPNHVHHRAAQQWFADGDPAWATTPMTECGFVRISSNPRAIPTAVSPGTAVGMLVTMRATGDHEFLPDTTALVVGDSGSANRMTGHQQVTDAHLIAVATAHAAAFATFDTAAPTLASDADTVVVVPL